MTPRTAETTDAPGDQGGVRGLVTRSTDRELCGGEVAVRQLRVVFGPELAGARALLLHGDAIELGREPGPGRFAIDAAEVSRRHARIVREPDGWTIADAGSRNGVHVDGVRVAAPVPLRHGTVVRVGPVVMVCEDTTVSAALGVTPLDQPSGTSVVMRALRAELAAVAPAAVAVLLEGETGVGKEVAAHALHAASGRPGPLVALNCAAIPAALAESELFGHVAGAFTSGGKARTGLAVEAAGGTLFLDEIGELPRELQAKLLRLLATGEVRPLGSSTTQRVDVRVVAATNRDLDAEVARGEFRADLLARLGACRITIPPLRARREDILLLTEQFLARERVPARLTAHAAEALVLHDWPFNVRELEQTIRQIAVRAAAAGVVRVEHLPAELAARVTGRGGPPAARPLPLAVLVDRTTAPDREGLLRVLAHVGGNVAEAARFFGRDRKQIYRWADRLGIPLMPELAG